MIAAVAGYRKSRQIILLLRDPIVRKNTPMNIDHSISIKYNQEFIFMMSISFIYLGKIMD